MAKFPGIRNTNKSPWKYKQELKAEYRAELRKMKQVPKSERDVQEWAQQGGVQDMPSNKKQRAWKIWWFWQWEVGTEETKPLIKRRREENKVRREKISLRQKERTKAGRAKRREHRRTRRQGRKQNRKK